LWFSTHGSTGGVIFTNKDALVRLMHNYAEMSKQLKSSRHSSEQTALNIYDSRLDLGRAMRIDSNFCGMLFRSRRLHFSRKRTITKVNFEINTMELKHCSYGKTHMLAFVYVFRFTLCLSD